MKRLTTLLPVLTLLGVLWMLPTACTDEETELGNNLPGTGAAFDGKTATFHANRAMSVREDSLMTTGYNTYNTLGIIGNYSDATFGKVGSTLYTQIALPSNYTDINFSALTIDSVVLTLVKQSLYPDTLGSYNFHFEVMQLAEPLLSDTLYDSRHELPVDPTKVFYDNALTVTPTDTVISLHLTDGIKSMLQQTATADQFIQTTKGLRVRLTEAGDMGMLGINFAATKTCLTVYFRYHETDSIDSKYVFLLGTGTSHYTHFEHDYTGSITQGQDSIDGSTFLYLEPLAGYTAYLQFDNDIRAFVAAHPTATVHHAELLLPLSTAADGIRPNQLLARKADGSNRYIADMLDAQTLSGFDGKYDSERNCYRLRVTQHVQEMLRNGTDSGTMILIDSRQSTAARTILDGIATTNPVRIEIIYTE